ncbi:hypothetical protein [Pedobacter sp. L105]|uniref:hypothetical protein n=1 Tax=Pedobacter sp. L105 TaxID=1641871 RepID=UPI00131AAA63|nr:hypothetical protein [Pedobacter sp. L105]
MARPKAVQPSTIETKIKSRLASLDEQIEALQNEKKHWTKVASDYETNRVTIESILSVADAPDLAAPKKIRSTSGKKATSKHSY